MKPLCIYHSADLDGKCSAAIVLHALKDVELLGWNYGDEIPWERLYGRDVIMVDVSFQPFEHMIKLLEVVESLTWIDHHKSAIEESDKASWKHGVGVPKLYGLWQEGEAGCELTWQYYSSLEKLHPGVPPGVRLLGRYDVWDHTNPNTLPMQSGMRLEDNRPESPVWEEVFHYLFPPPRILKNGETILQYQKKQNEAMAKARSFETELDGLRCIVCNAGMVNSNLFDAVWDPEKHDAMIAFQWAPKGEGNWAVSIYSPKTEIDLSALAKARGGGGHRGAAGFSCKELPFKLRGRGSAQR